MLISIICASVFITEAQINYVHNGSFEQYWRCPDNADEIKFTNYWQPIDTINHPVIGDTFGSPYCTPEYCNACCGPGLSVPDGGGVYYHYARTGNGMAQVQMYFDENDIEQYQRDYLQGTLKTTLTAGMDYCVTFYVVQEQRSSYNINNIGAYIDDGTIDTTVNCGLPQTTHVPQVYETVIIDDTLNWTRIQGIFTATGTEKYITIGNFFDAAHTDTTRVPYPSLGPSYYSWYLVDDVSVIPLDAVANAGPDVTTVVGDSVWIGTNDGYVPCRWYTAGGVLIDSNKGGIYVHPTVTTTYVMELEVCGMYSYDTVRVTVHPSLTPTLSMGEGDAAWVLLPNPARDEVVLKTTDKSTPTLKGGVVVRNMFGKVVYTGERTSLTTSIDISGWAAGVYVVELMDSDGGRSNLRLVKE